MIEREREREREREEEKLFVAEAKVAGITVTGSMKKKFR